MTRFALLLPLTLGVLVACDAAGPISPDEAAPASVLLDEPAQYIDVQPLGSDKAVINVTADTRLTLQVVGWEGDDFFTTYDPATLTLYYNDIELYPVHADRILMDASGHIVVEDVLDELGEVVATNYYFILHFDLVADGFADGDIVTMCLTEPGAAFDWCADVTIQERGDGGNGPNRPGPSS